MKRCPSCGASNPEAATWCSLCLARFEGPAADSALDRHAEAAPVTASEVPDSTASVGASAPGTVAAPAVRIEATAAGIALPSIEAAEVSEGGRPEPGAGRLGGTSVSTESHSLPYPAGGLSGLQRSSSSAGILSGSGAVDAIGTTAVQRPAPTLRPVVPPSSGRGLLASIERDPMGHLIQRCTLCNAANPIEENECSVCGADFLAALREPEKSREVDPTKALLWGLIPGGGFIPLGKKARFFGHLSLVVWLLSLTTLLFALSPRALLAFKLCFAAMAAAVWAASAVDAHRTATGEGDILLSGKRPIVIFAASLVAIFVMGFVLTWSAIRNAPNPAGDGRVYEVPPSPGG